MPIQEYTDQQGYKWTVEVPVGTKPENYARGLHLGPPDLTELGLVPEVQRDLHNKLMDHRILSAKDLEQPGQMAKVLTLVQATVGSATNAIEVLKGLVAIYHQDYYTEQYGGG